MTNIPIVLAMMPENGGIGYCGKLASPPIFGEGRKVGPLLKAQEDLNARFRGHERRGFVWLRRSIPAKAGN